MKKVVVIGHFATGSETLNGQTIKTKIVYDELVRLFGANEVSYLDTAQGLKLLLKLPFSLFRVLRRHLNVVTMPAYKAVFITLPILVVLNFIFRRRLHFVTIGGRLPLIARSHPIMRRVLRRTYCIYSETGQNKKELEQLGIHNVVVMPNCKPLPVVDEGELQTKAEEPYRLCTFSRVSVEKGIPDAAQAVIQSNQRLGRNAFTLDIYGQVEDETWFRQFMNHQPDYISYKGKVGFMQSSQVLRNYFILLFPTYYAGECFAGTLIDAMAAGLPVIASDWHANSELVQEGQTGFLFPVHDVESLVERLLWVVKHPDTILSMQKTCIKQASLYRPEQGLQQLAKQLA